MTKDDDDDDDDDKYKQLTIRDCDCVTVELVG